MKLRSILLVAVLWVGLAGCREAVKPPASAGELRVVSLAPNLTEMIFAIGAGDRLVGRTSACNYPPEAAAVPVVGGFGNPSLETLVALAPTLILDVDLADVAAAHKLEQLGLRRENVRCLGIDDVPEALRFLGQRLDRVTPAAELAEQFQREITLLRAQAATVTGAPSVLIEIWGDPVTTVGGNSYLSELVELAGGRNVAADVEKEYFQVAPEWVVQRDPEIILCLYMSEAGDARGAVLKRPGWEGIRAVKSGRVYDGFNNDLILRPGPRLLDGIAALRARIAEAPAP